MKKEDLCYCTNTWTKLKVERDTTHIICCNCGCIINSYKNRYRG